MMNRAVIVLVLLAAGCSEDDGATPGDGGGPADAGVIADAGSDEADDGGAVPDASVPEPDPVTPETLGFVCPGGTIEDGMNSLDVEGGTRTFHVALPADRSRPMGVVFSWHGFGDTGENFRRAMALDPDSVESLPLIIVTPDDTGLLPPDGLDWQLAKPDDVNRDTMFFEAMTACIVEQYDVDRAAIYSVGFSAGAVMTNMLHSRYPRLISAVFTASGAWFNDDAEVELVDVFTIDWAWPLLDATDTGAVLLTHGGPSDVTVANILDLEASAQAAIPFLLAANRVVVDCAHEGGHTLHPEVTPALITAFLAAHRAGTPSRYRSEALEGFPPSCTLLLPD